ncbi:sensor histidine kinase [Leptospira perolatii]|uniref:sensor histidine kinase n=1 Tax=Leptospira perolatii TaxID=2023191 RepID=UPI001FAF4F27|nr:sensor histidine kinase [Leptospira perolatii]
MISLDGNWEFQNGLIKPEEFDAKIGINVPRFIKVPGAWNSFLVNGQEHGGEGTGSYRLTIWLDPGDEIFAIQVNDVSTAYQVFLNNKLIYENGKTGESREKMTPSYKHPVIVFPLEKRVNSESIILQFNVSNYYHITGGLRKSIQFGQAKSIISAKEWEASLGWLIFGSTFVMGLYHLALFFMRRVDQSALWFGLFCMDVSIRTFFTGSVFAYELFSDSYWILIHKLDILSFVFALPLCTLFLSSIFPREFHKNALLIFIFLGLLFTGIVVVFSSSTYMFLIQGYQLIVGCSIPYMLYVIITAIVRKREGAILFLLGGSILLVTTVNDILNQGLVIKTAYLANWGLLGFLFSQTTLLSIRFTNAFIRLEELQKSLEHKVMTRTRELEEAKKIAENANSLKDTFISLVTHDLRSPIANVIGVLQLIQRDYETLDDESLLGWLERTEKISIQSLEMISTLLDLNRLRSGSFPIERATIYVYPEIENVLSKLWSQAKSKNINITNHVPVDLQMYTDRTLFAEIFVNLLSNAIKFCRENDSIKIECTQKSDSMEFLISDTGVGIPGELIPVLFSPEVKSTRLGTKNETGTGLGLPLVYSIIQAFNGKISVQSEIDRGTTFLFSIPQHY